MDMTFAKLWEECIQMHDEMDTHYLYEISILYTGFE